MSAHSAAVSRVSKHPQFASEVNADVLNARVVDPLLDARALNLQQQRLIHNASPEVDSLVEHVRELARTVTVEQREHLAAILDLVRDLAESNTTEGDLQRAVVGAAEEMAHEALDRRVRDALGVKAIANTLREPLGVIAHPDQHPAAAFMSAVDVVYDVLARVPAEKLTARSVCHELGIRKYTALVELVNNRQAART